MPIALVETFKKGIHMPLSTEHLNLRTVLVGTGW